VRGCAFERRSPRRRDATTDPTLLAPRSPAKKASLPGRVGVDADHDDRGWGHHSRAAVDERGSDGSADGNGRGPGRRCAEVHRLAAQKSGQPFHDGRGWLGILPIGRDPVGVASVKESG
jgi:hypothetical protein